MAMLQVTDELERIFSLLPIDLALRIISLLPSPLLFQCRTFCKASHASALSVLVHRPFFVYQKPSSECFLLPLDALSTPLPCSFKLGISSFGLFATSSNLICLRRSHNFMLDICVCSIFCKWKVMLPPIVHPNFNPRLLDRVFAEDENVGVLEIITFEAAVADERDEGAHSHGHDGIDLCGPHGHMDAHTLHPQCDVCHDFHHFRVVVAFSSYSRVFDSHSSYSRVFDSHQQGWSDPSHQPGNIRPAFSSNLTVSGFPVRVHFSHNYCWLDLSFPHVEGARNSTPEGGLVLTGVCENGRGHNFLSRVVFNNICKGHFHPYARKRIYSVNFDYQDKLYFLSVEKEKIICQKTGRPVLQCDRAVHRVQPEDVEQLFFATDSNLACDEVLPASTPCMLTLHIVHVDTTNWRMQITRENATALLQLSEMLEIPDNARGGRIGKVLLLKG